MKLKEASQQYFTHCKNVLKLKTYLHYLLLYNTHLEKSFGHREIKNISSLDIESFISSKSDLANSSIKLIICVLKNILNYVGNSLQIKYRIKGSKKQVQALTKDEQQKLERYILNSKLTYNYGIIISLYTGVRIGELLALTWQDIDFKRKTISISKTTNNITRNHKLYAYNSSPKTENSERIIPLPTVIIPILKELQKQNSKYVIANKFGEQVYIRVYQNSFSNVLKNLNMRHYGFHSLRHTFATRAVECGVDVKSLSEILGHSSVNTTLNKYVHSSLELKNRLIEKVGKWLKY